MREASGKQTVEVNGEPHSTHMVCRSAANAANSEYSTTGVSKRISELRGKLARASVIRARGKAEQPPEPWIRTLSLNQ